MDIESFSYNHEKLGCIDVEVIEKEDNKTKKNIIEVNVIFFKGNDECFITLSYNKEDNLNYKELKTKINKALEMHIN